MQEMRMKVKSKIESLEDKYPVKSLEAAWLVINKSGFKADNVIKMHTDLTFILMTVTKQLRKLEKPHET